MVLSVRLRGKTLTVLIANAVVNAEELDEDAEIAEPWTPRFRR